MRDGGFGSEAAKFILSSSLIVLSTGVWWRLTITSTLLAIALNNFFIFFSFFMAFILVKEKFSVLFYFPLTLSKKLASVNEFDLYHFIYYEDACLRVQCKLFV